MLDFHPPRLVIGDGTAARIGELARELGFTRTLIVADRGLLNSGHIDHAEACLRAAGIVTERFHDFEANPTSEMVEDGRRFAAPLEIDSLVAFGGGSSLDEAKGINFVLTNGGRMQDYRGYGLASKPMLPMIAVPTTAGTGSEVQSYALILDSNTHAKMACGDPKAAFRVVILDPLLTVTQPRAVTAASGYDAIAHAVETAVTTRRNPLSTMFSREAWRLLAPHFSRVLQNAGDLEARRAMQLGACYAGLAIDCSMLGAGHACANPLTARYGTVHGCALGVLLPHLVEWNGVEVGETYAEMMRVIGEPCTARDGARALADRLRGFADYAELPATLRGIGAAETDLPALAAAAATEWTGTFNPRAFDAAGALTIYTAAY